jgi:UDP-N-acetylglucosamine/UDP-N-acetylgalactosamine 4-epimerase
MKENIDELEARLSKVSYTWLVTGVAGFIGSNLLEYLLQKNQLVVGLDNFSTGAEHNLQAVQEVVGENWQNFSFIEGDVSDPSDCNRAVQTVDFVLHQAALGSVPRSIEDPLATNNSNITGFLNMLNAAREGKVKRFVYAASSSTYGDSAELPKVEDRIGSPLSPYAVTKYANELYAKVFSDIYDVEVVGLRYFNVFGYRQDPNGAYAAVIPRWVEDMRQGRDVYINGDGETNRDFCFVSNVVQANVLAALGEAATQHSVYNVAFGESTTLNELFAYIKTSLQRKGVEYALEPVYREFRQGDVRSSLASIERASTTLGYSPRFSVRDGLELYLDSLLGRS